ncbi:hypothetical protein QR680_008027 [Steinernema hermaphroditum]|uniref:Uncharacterized protein n=1 Tax=Steinernema hermaphroditum TaxID=289476 RepID=A0AA39IHG0_9BILA|nr:hypothetical protein QR680_008027 [Steinernema hermaphroditum]
MSDARRCVRCHPESRRRSEDQRRRNSRTTDHQMQAQKRQLCRKRYSTAVAEDLSIPRCPVKCAVYDRFDIYAAPGMKPSSRYPLFVYFRCRARHNAFDSRNKVVKDAA